MPRPLTVGRTAMLRDVEAVGGGEGGDCAYWGGVVEGEPGGAFG